MKTNHKPPPSFIILHKGNKYITFELLLYAYTSLDKHTSSCRTTLWRYLSENKNIKSVKLNNMLVYSLSDVRSDVELIRRLANPEALLKLITENEQ